MALVFSGLAVEVEAGLERRALVLSGLAVEAGAVLERMAVLMVVADISLADLGTHLSCTPYVVLSLEQACEQACE
jgi:hypothetical protein